MNRHWWFLALSLSLPAVGMHDYCVKQIVPFATLAPELMFGLEPGERFMYPIRILRNSDTGRVLARVGFVRWTTPEGGGPLSPDRFRHGILSFEGNSVGSLMLPATDRQNGPTTAPVLFSPAHRQRLAYFTGGVMNVYDQEDEGILFRYRVIEDVPHRRNALMGGAGDEYYTIIHAESNATGRYFLTIPDLGGDVLIRHSDDGRLHFRIQADLAPEVGNRRQWRTDYENRGLDAHFSLDGRHVLVAHQYGIGSVWEVESGRMVAGFPLKRSGNEWPSLEVSPYDNVFMVQTTKMPGVGGSGTHEDSVEFFSFDPEGGQQMVKSIKRFNRASEMTRQAFRDGYHIPIAFGPGRQVLVGTFAGDTYLYDLDQGAGDMAVVNSALAGGHGGSPITAVAFDPKNQFFATGSENGLLCVWSSHPGGNHYQLKGQSLPIISLQFTPEGDRLLIHNLNREDREGPFSLSGAQSLFLLDTKNLKP